MISLWFFSIRTNLCQSTNRLLHFLRRLRIPLADYGDYDAKRALQVFAVILQSGWKAAKRIFYFVLIAAAGFGGAFLLQNTGADLDFSAVVLPSAALSAGTAFAFWLAFSVWGAGFTAATTFSDEGERILIEYFRVDAKIYARSKIFFRRAIDLAINLPFFAILAAVTGYFSVAFFNIIALYAFKCLGGDLLGILSPRGGRLRGAAQLITFVLGCLLGGACIFTPVVSHILTQNVLVGIVALLFSVGCALFLWRYKGYHQLFLRNIADVQITLEKIAKQKGGAGFQLANRWDKGLDRNTLGAAQFPGKSGFDYLNAIFFHRHKRHFGKHMLWRIAIMAGLFIGLAVLALFNGVTIPAADLEKVWPYVPTLLFVIYSISLGRIVTSCVFVNCDIQMLHHVYFRSRETVLKSFKARFLYILKHNLLITTVLYAGCAGVILLLAEAYDPLWVLLLGVALTAMGVFFSFNDLFVYYCLQPYDADGKVKSWQYKLISGAVYMVSYANMQMRLPFIPYVIVISAITAAYLVTGLIALPHIAPKQFKLR